MVGNLMVVTDVSQHKKNMGTIELKVFLFCWDFFGLFCMACPVVVWAWCLIRLLDTHPLQSTSLSVRIFVDNMAILAKLNDRLGHPDGQNELLILFLRISLADRSSVCVSIFQLLAIQKIVFIPSNLYANTEKNDDFQEILSWTADFRSMRSYRPIELYDSDETLPCSNESQMLTQGRNCQEHADSGPRAKFSRWGRTPWRG